MCAHQPTTRLEGAAIGGPQPLDRNRKGNVAEAAVVFHAARLGIQVFRPLLEHGRYDLVLDVGGRLQRVQCKWAQRVGDIVLVRLTSNRLTPAGYVRTHYLKGEIDAVAAYCADLDRCYFLPGDLVTGRNVVHLRLAPAKNGQEAGLHWAACYELTELLADAAAHDDRSDDGGAPAATPLPMPNDRLVVSAHEFRDRFGRYVELSEKGTEIDITRYGRPLVRLVPVSPPDPDRR